MNQEDWKDRLNNKAYPLADRMESFWMGLSATDDAASHVVRQLRAFTAEVREEADRLNALVTANTPITISRLRVSECAADEVLIETPDREATGKTLRAALDVMLRAPARSQRPPTHEFQAGSNARVTGNSLSENPYRFTVHDDAEQQWDAGWKAMHYRLFSPLPTPSGAPLFSSLSRYGKS